MAHGAGGVRTRVLLRRTWHHQLCTGQYSTVQSTLTSYKQAVRRAPLRPISIYDAVWIHAEGLKGYRMVRKTNQYSYQNTTTTSIYFTHLVISLTFANLLFLHVYE